MNRLMMPLVNEGFKILEKALLGAPRISTFATCTVTLPTKRRPILGGWLGVDRVKTRWRILACSRVGCFWRA